jgi:hypothetical protein
LNGESVATDKQTLSHRHYAMSIMQKQLGGMLNLGSMRGSRLIHGVDEDEVGVIESTWLLNLRDRLRRMVSTC